MSGYAMISMNYIGYYLPIQFNLLSRSDGMGKNSSEQLKISINKSKKEKTT